MNHNPRRRQTLFTVGALAVASAALPWTATATAAWCSDVDVSFARGTGEAPGLGVVGGPFTQQVTAALSGRTVSVYPVSYPADFAQAGDGSGATDLSRHVAAVAANCPDTLFVFGGYSQGASVVDIALGEGGALGSGEQLPAAASPQVTAIAVFGNPGRLMGLPLTTSTVYGTRAIDQCNAGDPVCQLGGGSFAAHLRYVGTPVTHAVDFTVAALRSRFATGPRQSSGTPAGEPGATPGSISGGSGSPPFGADFGRFGGFGRFSAFSRFPFPSLTGDSGGLDGAG